MFIHEDLRNRFGWHASCSVLSHVHVTQQDAWSSMRLHPIEITGVVAGLTDTIILTVASGAISGVARRDYALADACADALSFRLHGGPGALAQEAWEAARRRVAMAWNKLAAGSDPLEQPQIGDCVNRNVTRARVKLVPVDEATRDRLADCPLIPMDKPGVGEIIRIRLRGNVSTHTYRVLDVMHDILWDKDDGDDYFDTVIHAVVSAV